MRRLVLSLLAASSVALLTACGSGGSAFNTSQTNIDRVVLATAGQPPGVFKVVPGGTILISALGVKGSQNAIVSSDTRFTFNVGPAPAGVLYQGGNSAQDGFQGVCSGFTQLSPASIPLLPAIPQSSLSTGGATDSVTFTAPTAASLNVPTAPNTVGPAPAAYCVYVNAIHTSDGVVGSATVYVGN
ncbi:MAG: hypothetical protein NVSMB5_13970 [Candidatus Velthaea sp.]